MSHLLEISHMYYAIESRAAAMYASKAIHAHHQGHQPQKNKPQKSASQCPNCTHSLSLATTTALHGMLSAKAVLKKVTGMQSATVLVMPAHNPLNPMELRRPPIVNTMERGRKLIRYKSTLRKIPHAMSCCQCSQLWNCRKYSPRGDCGI